MRRQSGESSIPLHKLVVVGCGGVGKSCLSISWVHGYFEETYDPTRADSYRKKLDIPTMPGGGGPGGTEHIVDLLDTAGQEEFYAVRDTHYRGGEGFVLVYSICDAETFEVLDDFRDQILRVLDDTHKKRTPMILVGNKCDLANEHREVSYEQAMLKAQQWRCPYMETSAKLRINVDEVFYELVKMVHTRKERKKNSSSHNSSSKDRKKSVNSSSSSKQNQQKININGSGSSGGGSTTGAQGNSSSWSLNQSGSRFPNILRRDSNTSVNVNASAPSSLLNQSPLHYNQQQQYQQQRNQAMTVIGGSSYAGGRGSISTDSASVIGAPRTPLLASRSSGNGGVSAGNSTRLAPLSVAHEHPLDSIDTYSINSYSRTSPQQRPHPTLQPMTAAAASATSTQTSIASTVTAYRQSPQQQQHQQQQYQQQQQQQQQQPQQAGRTPQPSAVSRLVSTDRPRANSARGRNDTTPRNHPLDNTLGANGGTGKSGRRRASSSGGSKQACVLM